MLLIKAVDYRILELCKAYNLSINGLANKAGMPPSTVASLLSEKSRNPTEDTIFKICIGFGMRMDKFYASNLFDLKNISLENTSQKYIKFKFITAHIAKGKLLCFWIIVCLFYLLKKIFYLGVDFCHLSCK